MGDIRDGWRMQACERKAENADRRLHELDSLRSDVRRLESSNHELEHKVDRLSSSQSSLEETLRLLREEFDQLLQDLPESLLTGRR